MDYKEVKYQLEAKKRNLENRLHSVDLPQDKKEELQRAIGNYEYIIELTDMNHYERGSVYR